MLFSKGAKSTLRGSWWVLMCLAFSLLFYVRGMHRKDLAFQELKQRLEVLEMNKESALATREDLLLQIKSQNDPAWIEMMLLKGLGMVPEGQVKVYFKQ